ncbi:unnamed protein product [Sphagnum troendelagicum]
MGTIAWTRVSAADESAETRRERTQRTQIAARNPLADVTNTVTAAVARTSRGRPPPSVAVANPSAGEKGGGGDDDVERNVGGVVLLKSEDKSTGSSSSALRKRGEVKVLPKLGSLGGEKDSLMSSRSRGRTSNDLLTETPKLEVTNDARTEERVEKTVTELTGKTDPVQKICGRQKALPKRKWGETLAMDEREEHGYEVLARSMNKSSKALKRPAVQDSHKEKLIPVCRKQEGKKVKSLSERNTDLEEETASQINLVCPSRLRELLENLHLPLTCAQRNGSKAAKKVTNASMSTEDIDASIAKLTRVSSTLSTPCVTLAEERDEQEARKKASNAAGVHKASSQGGEGDHDSRNENAGKSLKHPKQKVSKSSSDADDILLTAKQQHAVNMIGKVHTETCGLTNLDGDCSLLPVGNPGIEILTIQKYGEMLLQADSTSSGSGVMLKAMKTLPNDKMNMKKILASSRKQAIVSECLVGSISEPPSLSSDHISSAELDFGVQLEHNEPTSGGRWEGRNVSRCTSLGKRWVCEVVLDRGPLELGPHPLSHSTFSSEFLPGADGSSEERAEDVDHVSSIEGDVSGCEGEESALQPPKSFEDAEIPVKMLDCNTKIGRPTPLQAHVLAVFLKGCDVGIADQGQALVYGVPALVHTSKKRKSYVCKCPSPLCFMLSSSADLVLQMQAQELVEILTEEEQVMPNELLKMISPSNKKAKIGN